VYAQLILSGQDVHPFDNTTGAGPLELPTNGHAWWGKVTLSHLQRVDISIPVGSGGNVFDAALWWPEDSGDDHSIVLLQIVDPSGTVRDSSGSYSSVFQRARERGTIQTGTWKLRLFHYSQSLSGRQTVYFAAHRS
jgi:hypothetical protein